ncbi:MAG: ABC transporter permease, partial [Bacteroidota bacterium]
IRPPRIADWLLDSFCSYDYVSTARWDLHELFEYHLETRGVVIAKWLYFREVISIIYHLYFKGQSQYSLNTIAMLKNHILLAFRNFKKYKNYAILNVLGLSTGLLVFLLITLYTSYEFSYDTHHEKGERIYRVYKSINTLKELYLDAGTPGLLAEALKDEFPEVEAAVRFIKYRNQLMVANDHSFVEKAVFIADPSVFEIFSFEILHGNKDQLLGNGPNVAISESIAFKYFGRADVVNEVIKYDGMIPMVVSGVFRDMPPNSHFKMDMLMNFEWTMNSYDQDLSNWGNNPYFTYVLLKQGADAAALEAKLPALRAQYANDPLDADGQAVTYFLQKLSDVHFSGNIQWGLGQTADAQRLYIFTAVALIVLLMAAINYINLATARALDRMKETGIRKIMGAMKHELLGQYLIESGLLVLISLVLAVSLAYPLLPAFSYFVDKPLSFDFFNHRFWLQLVATGLGITLLSGLYPALVMSSFKPLNAINNRGDLRNKGHLRNGLVVLQFGLSAVLIISAFVIQGQLSFINTVDTGYTREQVVILSTRDDAVDEQLPAYMDEISRLADVDAVATSWSLPTNVTSNTEANWSGIDEVQRIPMFLLGVTHGFFDLYQIKLAAGRSFDAAIQSDSSAILLNEAAVEAFGWKEPIGREMILQDGSIGKVIGVVQNFHLKSLREKIAPLQIVLNPQYATLAVRVSGDLATTVDAIGNIYESFGPSYPFEYRYFEDIYDRAYADDTKTGQLTLVFSLLAVIIACLGLYGLASHKVATRVKELGVRKVMGASAANIATLLFKDFIILVSVAFVIAGPVAYLLLHNWLENYAYHISLTFIPFAFTFLTLMAFACVTVAYHTFKASVSSPVLALRDE